MAWDSLLDPLLLVLRLFGEGSDLISFAFLLLLPLFYWGGGNGHSICFYLLNHKIGRVGREFQIIFHFIGIHRNDFTDRKASLYYYKFFVGRAELDWLGNGFLAFACHAIKALFDFDDGLEGDLDGIFEVVGKD
jgi:hypothetical protein